MRWSVRAIRFYVDVNILHGKLDRGFGRICFVTSSLIDTFNFLNIIISPEIEINYFVWSKIEMKIEINIQHEVYDASLEERDLRKIFITISLNRGELFERTRFSKAGRKGLKRVSNSGYLATIQQLTLCSLCLASPLRSYISPQFHIIHSSPSPIRDINWYISSHYRTDPIFATKLLSKRSSL